MAPLFQSPFLQALGYAIANSLWQTALVWLVYLLLNAVFKFSAAGKYRLAVTAQTAGFLWFIITLQFYYTAYSAAFARASGNPAELQNINTLLPGAGFQSQFISWIVKAEQLLPYLSIAYLALMLLLCVRWVMGYRQTQTIRTTGIHKIPVEWRLFVKDIAMQLGIKQQVKIFLSETVHTPLTIGFLKPMILVPIASINHLTTDQLEAVLLHELAHIKRLDYLVNIILSVVEITLFFNPFTQLLGKAIKKERENSCDDWVLQFKYSATVYAEALLRIAYLQSAPVFAMAAAGSTKNDLLGRVKRMIDNKENTFNYRRQLLAFLLVTGILSSIAWLNPSIPATRQAASIAREQRPSQHPIQPVAVEPMAMKINNPLFNPVSFFTEPLRKEMRRNMESAATEIRRTAAPIPAEEHMPAIAPIVVDALNAAVHELAPIEKITAEKVTAREAEVKFDFSALDLENTLHLNNLAVAAMQKASASINRARKTTDRVLQQQAAAMQYIDREKMASDIAMAMNAMKKVDLDKLAADAMSASSIAFDVSNKPQGRLLRLKKVPVDKIRKEKIKTDKPVVIKEVVRTGRLIVMPDINNEGVYAEVITDTPVTIERIPVRAFSFHRVKMNDAAIAEIKLNLLLKQLLQLKEQVGTEKLKQMITRELDRCKQNINETAVTAFPDKITAVADLEEL